MEHASHTVLQIPDGDVIGSFLIGLVQSFRNIHAISVGTAKHFVEGVESTSWYPMTNFFSVLDEVCECDIDYAPILFRAGIAFVEDWYLNCGGKAIVSCAEDYLRLQEKSWGYSAVHRGDPINIGSTDLLELDESAGCATIVCITPYPKEFERGVVYGGMLMAGDMQFVQVESFEEPYNRYLSKKTLTIRFRKKPDEETSHQLETLLAGMSPEQPLALSAPLYEAMAWQLKGVEEQRRVDRLYYQQSNLLLSKATDAIYKLSHYDELTGLLNRRAVFEQAKRLLALSTRQDWSIAFIMIDIDHFKSINDRWGHAVGDETLRFLSALLRRCLRDSDLLGRIGGEEFLIVLPNSNLDGASTLAESLCVEVANHVQLSPANRRIPMTISLGVTVAEGRQVGEIESYVMQADQALYRSKLSGRNQFTCFKSSQVSPFN